MSNLIFLLLFRLIENFKVYIDNEVEDCEKHPYCNSRCSHNREIELNKSISVREVCSYIYQLYLSFIFEDK